MPHKPILQQAVSDTAMDIQEAENGTETSKFKILAKPFFFQSWSFFNFFFLKLYT